MQHKEINPVHHLLNLPGHKISDLNLKLKRIKLISS